MKTVEKLLEIIKELDVIIEKSNETKTNEEIEFVINKVSNVIDDIEKDMDSDSKEWISF